ncbi:hypothetical protein [Sphingobacterium faecium]|uniref:hypothetical protein n=1 Tax=Sphingobacterium faecium TaxID=34087 RepID=UPI002468F326|nr:hypothetical protein [Sphingobacterium faecium]MDH5826665.1 hypothetical protein [Sphingobacterium faecium]
MFKFIVTSFVTACFTTVCAQHTLVVPKTTVQMFPYLTKENTYVYVDSCFTPVLKDTFSYATPFYKSGYAFVANTEQESALIDSQGKLIESYTESMLKLEEVNGLTILIKETGYEKKLPFWKWDWNIMSTHIKKTAAFVHIQARILESNQSLFNKKVRDGENDHNFSFYPLDDRHVVWNGDLYKTENKSFRKLNSKIDETLDSGRYIKTSSQKFDIWNTKNKQPLLSHLTGRTSLSVTIRDEEVVLDSINQDRYAPTIPKILYDERSQQAYLFPQYDKAFPKHIVFKNQEQEDFLKETKLIYSVNNSPYFILGKFNYDHTIWAYDWRYLDDKGNFLEEISVQDFFITDQLGNILWPSTTIILDDYSIEENWDFHKIRYVQESKDLFIISLKHKIENLNKKGLWNREAQYWELEPGYSEIIVLDVQRELYALQQGIDGEFILYNNKKRKQIGHKSYASIYPNGMVSKMIDGQKPIYFYIDLETGKEYRAY